MLNPKECAAAWKTVVQIYKQTADSTPAETMANILTALRLDTVKEVFAIISAIKKNDGRIYGKNRDCMNNIPVNPECTERNSSNPVIYSGLDEIHTSHINQLITELRKVMKEEEKKQKSLLWHRGKAPSGRWVEGFLFQLYSDGKFNWCIGNQPLQPIDYSELLGEGVDWCIIDPSTICSLTCFSDINKQQVWEHDIVRIVCDGEEYIYEVVFDSQKGFIATNGKVNYGKHFQYLSCCEEIEVIGTAFDNPELLK